MPVFESYEDSGYDGSSGFYSLYDTYTTYSYSPEVFWSSQIRTNLEQTQEAFLSQTNALLWEIMRSYDNTLKKFETFFTLLDSYNGSNFENKKFLE